METGDRACARASARASELKAGNERRPRVASGDRRSVSITAMFLLGGLVQGGIPANAADPGYRDGPGVIDKPAIQIQDDGQQVIDEFGRAYEERGRPRVMLFWNRSFSEQLNDIKKTEKIKKRDGVNNKSVEGQKDGTGGEIHNTDGRFSEVQTEKTIETTVDAGKRAGPTETYTWALEDAVLRGLTAMGVHVVDRSAAMRFSAQEADSSATSADAIRTETQALLDKADVLLEILSAPEPTAPSGLVYRILVKEAGTGRVLASKVTDARPTVVKTRGQGMKIGRKGLERVTESDQTSVGQVARELTKQVLSTMTAGFSR